MSDQTLDVLEELLAWTKLATLATARATVASVVTDPRHLVALEATDGVRSQAEVAKVAGLTQPTVSRLWAAWRRQGLLIERGGKPRHLVRPTDLGYEIGSTPSSSRTDDAGSPS